MSLDPFSQNSILYGSNPLNLDENDPSFFDTVGATLGYQYDPIIEYISNKIKFRDEVDPNYFPLEDMEGYEEYESELLFAQNAEHMVEMKRAIDENVERRRVLAESSFGAHFLAGIADPINLVALPFGGPAVGLGRAFLRGGAGVATLQAGQEALRAPLDPLATPEEAAINIGSAFVAGGLLVGAVSVPMTRRATAYKATEKALGERALAEQPEINTSYPAPTPERPLSQVQNWEVDAKVSSGEQVIPALRSMVKDLEESVAQAEAKFASAATPENMNTAKAELDAATAKLDSFKDNLRKEEAEFALFKKESEDRQATQAQIDGIDNPYGLKKNIFTDSWAFQFLTTPLKRVLQDTGATDMAKRVMISIAGDSGLSINLNTQGLRVGPSVYQKAAIRDGEWVQIYDAAREMYKKEYGKGGGTVLDYDLGAVAQKAGETVRLLPKNNKTFYDWMTETNIKRMKGEKASNDAEAQFMGMLDDFYAKWETRLKQTGLLGNVEFARRDLTRLTGEVAIVEARIKSLQAKKKTEANVARLANAKSKLAKLNNQIDETNSFIELADQKLIDGEVEPFNPRYWRQDIIKERRQDFFNVLHDWYSKNPYTYVLDKDTNSWSRVKLDDSYEAVAKRVNETIDKILGLRDVTDEGSAFYGYTKSKHFRHRDVDIPNALVTEFIETNPLSIMRAYTQKIAPQYEFQVKFGKSLDDVLDDVEDDLLANGMKQNRVNRILRDIRHVNERVQGTVIRDPDAMSLKTAVILKDLAMLNYLGSAGFATLPDFAKVMMEHELGPVFKSLFSVMSDHKVRMNAQEGRIAGEIIDILKGDAHLRHVEMMRNNPLNDGFMGKVRTGFFMLNGVAPMTTIFKKMDSMVRAHTLIDYSLKLTGKHPDGKKATDFEIEYLARYNITKKEAEVISSAPWQRTDNDLFLPNTLEWEEAGIPVNIIEDYRSALNSGIGNTVLMGTPADKPIAVDGVFYVPMHVARKLFPSVKEDSKYKGYYRIENGLLGLPFQFMSYSFAAANKITASIAQNQVRNRAVGIAAAMGLGYMGMSLKYSDWQMERMTWSETFTRSFDASGVAAMYSDLFYTAMSTSMALGGPDIGMGIIKPKYQQGRDIGDAITGVLGAGPSWAYDTSKAIKMFLDGDFGEGTGALLRQMPASQLFFLKDTTNETARAFAGGRY